MNMPRTIRDFLRTPTTNDKLTLFRTLFDAREVDTDLALALLKIIHAELSKEQERDRATYKRYAETIATLRFHKADMLKQVVKAWNEGRNQEPKWLSNGVVK